MIVIARFYVLVFVLTVRASADACVRKYVSVRQSMLLQSVFCLFVTFFLVALLFLFRFPESILCHSSRFNMTSVIQRNCF